MRGQRKCAKVPNTPDDIPEPPVRHRAPPEASPCQRASRQPRTECKKMAKDASETTMYKTDVGGERRFWGGVGQVARVRA